ncbi:helix-turn-helix domain-containing protein [Streptomyces sp. NPDC012510]|uniref:helix-turn-helix domain-containing protein n=1 Tax=Streptomyces sp. NPDC012510 TaxID=3364838 RepID=UPI0036ECDD8C
MAKAPDDNELAAALEELKQRSGRSYQSIGQQINASKSTVYRYCAGHSLPKDFATVERFAKACQADRAETTTLYRLWVRALETSEAPGRPARKQKQTHILPDADSIDRPADVPVLLPPTLPKRGNGRRRRRDFTYLLAAVMSVLLLGTTAASAGPPRLRQPQSRHAAQWISGPGWVSFPTPVPPTHFGVTINSTTGTMPSFRTGAVRLWDSGTLWADLEPERGEFDWSVLDRLVGGARRAGLPALFVMGGTPAWASPNGPVGPYDDDSRAAPPDRLADWDAFVHALVHRYRGRIEAYELWVLANDSRFYNGSVETLTELTRRAARIIRAADPEATVVCPGMGRLWNTDGIDVLRRFAELGGYRHCDVAGIKLYQRTASDPPETMLDLTYKVDEILHDAGVHPPVWNTGTMYEIPLQDSLDSRRATNYAVRFYLVGLYARDVNLERMYFYNWGGTRIPVVLQAEGGSPTRAALAVEQLQRWLGHARIHSCGHGLPAGLPSNVWECEFTVTGSQRDHQATIRWTDTGTATTDAGPDVRAVHRLNGDKDAVRPGDPLTITEEPVLIEH